MYPILAWAEPKKNQGPVGTLEQGDREREKSPPLQWKPQHTRTETHASCLRRQEYYYFFFSPHHGIGSHPIIIILRSVLGRLQRLFPQFASILRGEQHSVIEIAHTNRIYFVLFV